MTDFDLTRLAEALNATPGLTCDPDWELDVEDGWWGVLVEPDREADARPTLEAWTSLMVLSWGLRSWVVGEARLDLSCSPPMLNPAPDGWAVVSEVDPDVVAAAVDEWNLIPYDTWALDEMLAGFEEE